MMEEERDDFLSPSELEALALVGRSVGLEEKPEKVEEPARKE